ncbi:YdbH domain-containing protein [Erythrobacter sp. NE805]|uniref:intermembrane phospholipid transport protein YdbH family protein n=1 Tax=Erythrobacter sp. NE805 TaxID=3389875 RepID=UPI00396B05BF
MPVPQPETAEEGPDGGGARGRWPRRRRSRIALGLGVAGLAMLGAAWASRERIAQDVIDDYLAARNVPATYRIVRLSPDEQVIENLVIGDPAAPDLTVKRMVIATGFGWAGPEVRRVRVEGARVYASFRSGSFSLGALDPLVFTGSKEPPALPAIDLVLKDARALLDSDFGRVGVTLEGAGRLDDGFAGTLAATAPGIGTEGCRAGRATLYGRLTTDEGAPALDGPLRLGELACAGARLARADIGTRLALAPDFAAAKADLRIEGSGASVAGASAAGLGGTGRADWSQGRLALGHDLALTGIAAPQGRLARLALEGSWRGAVDGSSGQWEGALRGTGLAPAPALGASLAAAERSAEGTLLAPLIGKARTSLARALAGGSLAAEATVRHKGAEAALILPSATLATRDGTRVLALSRAGASIGAGGLKGLAGSLLAGGAGLPSLNGRIAQAKSGGGWTLRLAMADYASGANRLAVPRLTVQASPAGTYTFDGLVTASGALPGGAVSDLTLPLEGRYAPATGLALGTRCTPLRFAGLTLSGLTLKAQRLDLCPERGAPILAYRDSLRLAARTGALNLAGTLGESPARISASRVMLRYPQPFAVDNLAATIGSGTSEVRLSAASLTGSLSGTPGGGFSGGTARLAAVPFDLDRVAGKWRFAEGTLSLTDTGFTLSDRPAEGAAARFTPLAAEGARLTLAENRIAADALLRHEASGRGVVAVALTHDLSGNTGSARLAVPGLVFDKRLQPDDLTPLAQGVVALADGTVTGSGRVDWQDGAVTSGGTFATEGFDFAAAFGPVRGLKGKVTFTDLLNLTTAPDQVVTIAAINPGIEVLAGRVQFELTDGTRLALEDARFPFMGGTLLMRPLEMDFSRPEERRYVFEIVGLDAAKFVAQMELKNISATGVFDGTVPIVFDEGGNGRIAQGLLIARPGGGNVSYIGELAYENLGTMGNYAFSALRSLDYRQMSVALDGALAGEIITSFNFDGVRQGEGASRNFITKRLAKLPIQFRINVRSQSFTQLAIIARGYADPTAWGNPFDRGLLSVEDGRIIRGPRRGGPPVTVTPVTVKTSVVPPPGEDETPVQPPESDKQP